MLGNGWERPPDESVVISEQRDRLRQALTRISSFAATCRSENTPEWMAMLVDHLNQTCETLNVPQRLTMGKGEIECVDGDHEDYRG